MRFKDGSRSFRWWLVIALLPAGCLPLHWSRPAGPAEPPGPIAKAKPGIIPAGYQVVTSPQEHVAVLKEQLENCQQQKQFLLTRIQALNERIAEKDKLLAQAAEETRLARKDLLAQQEELRRWKQEVEILQANLRAMERENVETLKMVIQTLEGLLEPPPKRP